MLHRPYELRVSYRTVPLFLALLLTKRNEQGIIVIAKEEEAASVCTVVSQQVWMFPLKYDELQNIFIRFIGFVHSPQSIPSVSFKHLKQQRAAAFVSFRFFWKTWTYQQPVSAGQSLDIFPTVAPRDPSLFSLVLHYSNTHSTHTHAHIFKSSNQKKQKKTKKIHLQRTRSLYALSHENHVASTFIFQEGN